MPLLVSGSGYAVWRPKAEVYLGLPLLHSMDLDALASACAEQRRHDCLICVAPLKIPGGTGSPVAPVCVL